MGKFYTDDQKRVRPITSRKSSKSLLPSGITRKIKSQTIKGPPSSPDQIAELERRIFPTSGIYLNLIQSTKLGRKQ